GQFTQLLGIKLPHGEFSTLEKVILTVEHISQTNMIALALGVGTIVVAVVLKRINKNLPGALLALVFCVIAVITMNLAKYGIRLTGDIPSAIPPFRMLSFNLDIMGSLAGGAAVIAIIGLVEAVSISKSIAAQTQQKLDSNQEFIGQGIANMGGAFFACIAGSGSFTRSAITFQNGGKTRMAGVLAGVAVLVILIFLAPFAKYIPSAALAGVIMVVAYSMIDKNAVKKVFSSNKNDGMVLVVTFLTTIFSPDLEYAIYFGVLISIVLFLKNTGNAGVHMLEATGQGNFIEIGPDEKPVSGGAIKAINLEGSLYFGSAMDLDEKMNRMYSAESRVFVINFKHVSYIDITALEIIESFIKRARNEERRVILCGVSDQILISLEKGHILGLVGAEAVFMCEREIFGSLRKSLAAAHLLSEMPGQVLRPAVEVLLRGAAVPEPVQPGRRSFKNIFAALERFLEEPFLQAEIYAVDVMLKKI
ncbi:MAG: SulP family inorganic anion transporter, partial [Desulfocucumaceae bacterium]